MLKDNRIFLHMIKHFPKLFDLQRYQSCECAVEYEWRRQIGGFRSGWANYGHGNEKEHFRRHSLLDGSGGHQTVALRLPGRYLVLR